MTTQATAPAPVDRSPRYRTALERIPHLVVKICATWGSRELDAFLSHLLMDSRDGHRQGLPPDVAEEVLFLMETNKMRRAIELVRGSPMSLAESYRMVDKGDQARLGGDAFSDPLVSRDTSGRSPPRQAARSARAEPASGSQLAALGELIMMLVINRWVLGTIFVILTDKFLWPFVRTFL